MPVSRIKISTIKKLDAKILNQQIADALGTSEDVVSKYVGLAAAAILDWTTVQGLV